MRKEKNEKQTERTCYLSNDLTTDKIRDDTSFERDSEAYDELVIVCEL